MKFDSIPFAHVVYCDDVRQEITGKLMLIGVYSDTMFFPAFPTIIPQLFLLGSVQFPLALRPRKLAAKAMLGDAELHRVEIDLPEAPSDEEIARIKRRTDTEMIGRMRTNVTLTNTLVTEPTRLQLRVELDGVRIACNMLRIEQTLG